MWPSPSPFLRSSSNLAKQGIGPFLASPPLSVPPPPLVVSLRRLHCKSNPRPLSPLFLLNFQPLSIHFPPLPSDSLPPSEAEEEYWDKRVGWLLADREGRRELDCRFDPEFL